MNPFLELIIHHVKVRQATCACIRVTTTGGASRVGYREPQPTNEGDFRLGRSGHPESWVYALVTPNTLLNEFGYLNYMTY